MPWCPKCKNEYVEGITSCADCGTELVSELPDDREEDKPVILGAVDSEETGDKFVTYLNYSGIQTAAFLISETGDSVFLAVAPFEKIEAEMSLCRLAHTEQWEKEILLSLLPLVDQKLEEIQEEEATKMFTDLQSETSSVYVKKKDKYNDLKFSGIAFLVFGIIGVTLLCLNLAGILNFFNTFSSIILIAVFVIFFLVGIGSLIRAKNLKGMVAQEAKANDEVMDWIAQNMSDDWIAAQINPDDTEEDNYFHVHAKMCEQLADIFPFLNADYIDQLMDERYNLYCEKMD